MPIPLGHLHLLFRNTCVECHLGGTCEPVPFQVPLVRQVLPHSGSVLILGVNSRNRTSQELNVARAEVQCPQESIKRVEFQDLAELESVLASFDVLPLGCLLSCADLVLLGVAQMQLAAPNAGMIRSHACVVGARLTVPFLRA